MNGMQQQQQQQPGFTPWNNFKQTDGFNDNTFERDREQNTHRSRSRSINRNKSNGYENYVVEKDKSRTSNNQFNQSNYRPNIPRNPNQNKQSRNQYYETSDVPESHRDYNNRSNSRDRIGNIENNRKFRDEIDIRDDNDRSRHRLHKSREMNHTKSMGNINGNRVNKKRN